MNRTLSRPVILRLPSDEMKPRILRFPDRTTSVRSTRIAPSGDSGDDALSEVRERLFRMIVASEWDRSHGNRASLSACGTWPLRGA